ncbi:CPBP family intramembrane glutamic endopeptidase [Peptostreptococcus equinus]|uniref:Type II CAAX endopeptidase family protein n=1 Tax=Peptostreptococcus equinus TaxID=3003601 RepID=A0ABY7JMI3_9FIRM|nr:type II CAAX endopeptidase family protein [Peptostreptococcus sp. CBA3647]WAW14574.1 type II CAAX endopeptidase family protein [Peptostreptococcus sp. CBA3647]
MNESKSNLLKFFLVAYGLPILLTPFLYIANKKGVSTETFPLAWMFFPACGVVIGKLSYKSVELKKWTKIFFICFVVTTFLMALFAILSAFLNAKFFIYGQNILLISMSLLAFAFILYMNVEERESNGLGFNINFKIAIKFILIYIIMYIFTIIVSSKITGDNLPKIQNINFLLIIYLPIQFILTSMLFFGEEYGWRYYLQPIMQKKFGLRLGVIFFGIIWGLWHAPLDFFFYSSSTGIQTLVNQIILCIALGIFFAWAYMKTKNIWLVAFMHCLHNNMYGLFTNGELEGIQNLTWKDVLISALIMSVIYLPILLTKEFRKSNSKVV